MFSGGDLSSIEQDTVAAALASAPHSSWKQEGPDEWPSVVDLLVTSGLAESRGAARRTIKEGGAYLNNERIVDESAVAEPSALVHGRWWLLRRGKKSFASVEMVR